MTIQDEFNEIREELDLDEIETNFVNNVVPKPEEFSKPSRRNTHFLRPRYIPVGRISNFSFGFIPKKITIFEEISLTPISQT